MKTRLHHFHPPYQKHRRRVRYLLALVLTGAGVGCFFLSDVIRDLLPYILGFMLLFLAAMELYEALMDGSFDHEDTDKIANSVVYVIMAAVALIKRDEADNMVGAIWGVLGLLLASRHISHAVHGLIHREGSRFGHSLHVIQSLLSIGISTALLLDPPAHLHFHIYILGLELLDTAIRIALEEK